MNISNIANQLKDNSNNIILIYAFNATGKTRLSVAFKDATKEGDKHTGVYYNAFSEDLFIWDNDTEHNEQDVHLTVKSSSLNKFNNSFTENDIHEKLKPYNPKYNFTFKLHNNPEDGIQSIYFYTETKNDDKNTKTPPPIKISRGEERIFIWCFFLVLFEVEDWVGRQSKHFFIDDPVSSLDEHNIFITASTIFDLIDNNFKKKKIIITTHHIGLYSILTDWLTKGDKSERFKKQIELFVLDKDNDKISLKNHKTSIFLYHLYLLQVLKKAIDDDTKDDIDGGLYTYHFVLLRQVLENISSFLGSGQFSYVLQQIKVEDVENTTRIINSLSHQSAYRSQIAIMGSDNKQTFKYVFNKLITKYKFKS